jgi:hypothetical protein
LTLHWNFKSLMVWTVIWSRAFINGKRYFGESYWTKWGNKEWVTMNSRREVWRLQWRCYRHRSA